MLPRLRTLTVTGFAALALLLAACGVEAGDGAATTPTTSATTSAPERERTGVDQQVHDNLVNTYQDLGFTDDEAECLADGMSRAFDEDGAPNPGAAISLFSDCNIPASRMGDIAEGLGGGSLDDTMRRSLIISLTNSGLSEPQATCVADAYVDEYGADATKMQDDAVLRELLQGCDVDPDDFNFGN